MKRLPAGVDEGFNIFLNSLYAKYYETPYKFHMAINGFFQTVNQKYNTDLKNIMTLKFQLFENQDILIYPV